VTRDPITGELPDVTVTFRLPKSVRDDSLTVPEIIDAELVGPDTATNDFEAEGVESFQRSTGAIIESLEPNVYVEDPRNPVFRNNTPEE